MRRNVEEALCHDCKLRFYIKSQLLVKSNDLAPDSYAEHMEQSLQVRWSERVIFAV